MWWHWIIMENWLVLKKVINEKEFRIFFTQLLTYHFSWFQVKFTLVDNSIKIRRWNDVCAQWVHTSVNMGSCGDSQFLKTNRLLVYTVTCLQICWKGKKNNRGMTTQFMQGEHHTGPSTVCWVTTRTNMTFGKGISIYSISQKFGHIYSFKGFSYFYYFLHCRIRVKTSQLWNDTYGIMH